jgi:molybdopterin-guanine dinucleotide biosynthesis protein
MSILLGNKGPALAAYPDDFMAGLDEDEPKDLPAGKFLSLQEIFGLSTSDCEVQFTTASNYPGVIVKIMSKDGGGYPSNITLGHVRMKTMMRVLKEFGEVKALTSTTFYSGIATRFIVEIVTPKAGSSLFLSVNDVGSVAPDNYPEYKDDVISVASYMEYDEEMASGEVLYTENPSLWYSQDQTKLATEIASRLNEEALIEFKEVGETYVEMIIQTTQGLTTKRILFDHKFDDSDLDLHYGEGFSEFHRALVERIKARNKGITMFHGPPGTGKTHYIRRLLPELSEAGKRVILIPKHVLGSLESPGFNEFMLRNFIGEKIVFIIEDSESIIAKRAAAGEHRSELVSTLLNVTDGILNDIFSIQVILTFNTNLESIDEALQRKGRLTAKYKFDLLPREAALKMAKHIGVEILDNKDGYTLADIYALRETEEDDILINQKGPKVVVGF